MSRHVQEYQKKPVRVEAIQFDGTWHRALEIMKWADGVYFVPKGHHHDLRTPGEMDRSIDCVKEDASAFLVVATMEGDMRCGPGWWVIRGVKGEFYPCDDEIFKQTYNKTEEK